MTNMTVSITLRNSETPTPRVAPVGQTVARRYLGVPGGRRGGGVCLSLTDQGAGLRLRLQYRAHIVRTDLGGGRDGDGKKTLTER